MRKVFDKTVQQNENILTEYVSEDQMFEQGIGGTGQELGEYSPVTVELKKLKGQRTDHVTGRDTGRMHRSLRVKKTAGAISIEHAGEEHMDDFEHKYRQERPFDLTEENINDFKDNYIKDAIQDLIKSITQ